MERQQNLFTGCRVKVSPQAQVKHKSTRVGVWRKRIMQEGGTFLEANGHGATHLILGDEPPCSAPVAGDAAAGVPLAVHYSWLEGCLAKRRRLAEADFHPTALAEAAAREGGGGHAAQAPAPHMPTPAAVAAAAAASASAAAGGHQLLRQLAVKSSALTAADVRQLLLHLLADAPRPHWLSLHGRPGTVVVAELPGLDRQLLLEKPPPLGALLGAVQQRVTLQATAANEVASQTTAALLAVPPPGGRKRKQPVPPQPGAAAAATGAAAGEGGVGAQSPPTAAEAVFPPSFYAATARQMRAIGFPPGSADAAAAAEATDGGDGGGNQQAEAPPALPPGWVCTSQRQQLLAAGSEGDSQLPASLALVAVDCEMVITAQGFELARVSLAGAGGERLLDELVAPDRPVLDYNTKYSGISEQMLAGVCTSVADAQRLVMRFVGPGTLLVGHTLENDLKVLRLAHGRCCDTAILFPNPRGLPHRSSLRMLAQQLLGRTIQQGSHDSLEDAEVALRAAQLKFRGGPTAGTAKPGSRHLLELLAARGRRLALVAPREVLMLHAVPQARVVPAASDSGAVEAALRLLGAGEQQQQQQQKQEGTLGAGSSATSLVAAPAQLQQQEEAPVAESLAASPAPGRQQQQQQQEQQQGQPPDLLWLQLSELWWHLEGRAARLASQEGTINLAAAVSGSMQDPEALRILQRAGSQLARLAAALPPGALLLVLSGQGDTPLCRALHGEGSRRKGGGFAAQNAQHAAAKASIQVRALVQRAQQGVCLVVPVPRA